MSRERSNMNQRHPLPVEDERPEVPPPAVEPLPAKPPLAEPLSADAIEALKNCIVEALHKCFDPEIPVNIYELGLIYEIIIAPTGAVGIQMTLTSPGCPVAGTLPGDVQRRVLAVENVTSAKVDVVWDPPWTPARMSEAAKLQLGIDD
jgi:FeS assembly SUF system protein